MRIFIFLLISSLLHLVLINYNYFNFDEVSTINKHASFSVMLLNKNLLNSKGPIQSLSETKKIESINAKKELGSYSQVIDSNPAWETKHKALDLNKNQEIIKLKDYYPIAEVDRKAIPQMNIDQSMLAEDESSGLPIKLRLYINAYGRVVKVEPIAVLDQDTSFAEKIASLLYEVRFLPAKRKGLDVDSYQDLQLSFNPITIPGENYIESD